MSVYKLVFCANVQSNAVRFKEVNKTRLIIMCVIDEEILNINDSNSSQYDISVPLDKTILLPFLQIQITNQGRNMKLIRTHTLRKNLERSQPNSVVRCGLSMF